ncbi:DNA-directed RNA polymerase subunit K [archaeon]|nr:DNA-directed RNA polymerase subunit K [archaeon]NHV06963.1 DNA-directed RNA polymerase subunit K [Nitrososphaerota archaeon]
MTSEEDFSKFPKRLTRFERARIIGIRALQLNLGAPPLVPIEETEWDALKIAEQELSLGVLPISIRRTFPDGSYIDLPIKELIS